MIQRIKPIAIKEFRQVLRDRGSLAILLFLPVFLLVMFGYALNFDVKHIHLAVLDLDKSPMSRQFLDNFLHSEYFDLEYYLYDSDEIDDLMANEKARVALIIPPDFSHRLVSGENASVQVIVDGANASAAATAVGYVNLATLDISTKITTNIIQRKYHLSFTQTLDFRPQVWYNPELLSAEFLIPGLIGFILMMIGVVSTALSVVREKERGTMEQITVSPIKPVELILGKTIPFVCTSLFATVLILLAGHILFGVTIKGSIPLLFIVTLIYIIGALGLGLLISTLVDTQQLAFMISVLVTFLPAFILSGFIFPIRNMPLIIQAITYIIPMRYFLVVLRCLILKGVGLATFWEQIVMLIAFALVTIFVSSIRMRRVLS
jgi:ABC-2 type transport system permease protein